MDSGDEDFIECSIDSIVNTRKQFFPKIVKLLNECNTLKMDILLNCEKDVSKKCDCRSVNKNITGDTLENSSSFLCCVHKTRGKRLSEDSLLFQTNQNYKHLSSIVDKVKSYKEEDEKLEFSKIPDLTEEYEVLFEILSKMERNIFKNLDFFKSK